MTLRTIITHPNPNLRKIAAPVECITEDVKNLVADMIETMHHSQGVGLAATQIDIHQRIITIDISNDQTQPIALINPEILSRDGVFQSPEGCLSVPEKSGFVERANTIKVKALTTRETEVEFEAQALLAAVIQHEIDHLDGKLFIDYLSDADDITLATQHLTDESEQIST